jgi:hypothetical protein
MEPTELVRRFFEVLLKVSIDPNFTADDVWTYAPRLLQDADDDKPIPQAGLVLMGELSQRLGLRAGASVPDVMVAAERAFGPCPYGQEELLKLVKYLRQQRNGAFSSVKPKKGPSIRGEF